MSITDERPRPATGTGTHPSSRSGAPERGPSTGGSSPLRSGVRPSAERAAAAARLVGAPADADAVATRMRHAAQRASIPPAGPARLRADGPRRWAAAAPSPAAERLRRLRVDDRRRHAPAPPPAQGAAALALAPAAAPEAAPQETRHRHLRIVAPGTLSPAQRRRRARAVLLGSIAAASMIAFALVYFHVVLAQRQFAIDHLDTRVQQEQATYQNLRLQVAQLGSPQQIISTAVGQLGMVQPAGVTYLTAPAGGATAATPTTVTPLGTNVTPGAPAPAGDANWPTIKSQLAGRP